MTTKALLAFALLFAGCHAGPSEPTPPQEAPAKPSGPKQQQVHRIIDKDHRHVVDMQVDDVFVLPADPAFDWRVDFEDKSAFARYTEGDAGGEAYRLTKAGPYRTMVYGDPKCLKLEAGCGISRRRWDITFAVK